MCVVWLEKHARCRHVKKMHLINPCASGVDENDVCLNNLTMVVYDKIVHHPSLCVACYRLHEELIFSKYASDIDSIGQDIERCKTIIQFLGNLYEQEHWIETLKSYEQELADVIEKRGQELEYFRRNQGVWGDG